MHLILRKWALSVSAVLCILTLLVSGCASLEIVSDRAYNKLKNFLPAKKSADKKDSTAQDLGFAEQQYNLGKYDVAEFYFKKVMAKHPDDTKAIRRLPWVYLFQKRYDKSLTAFQRAYTHYRKDTVSLIGMGWSYYSLRNYELAMDAFAKAEKLSPDSYHVHKGKAFTYLALGREVDALQELGRIYNPDEVQSIIDFWNNSRIENPERLIETVPEQPETVSLFTLPVEHPRYPAPLMGGNETDTQAMNQAWGYYRNQSYQKAVDAFKDLPHLQSESLDALNGLAWSYLNLNQIRKAEKTFNDILRFYPNFIGALKGSKEVEKAKTQEAAYADFYYDEKKYNIARIKARDLKNKYPQWAYPLARLGFLELQEKDFNAARQLFQKALELGPEDPLALRGMKEIQKVLETGLYRADQALEQGDYKTAAWLYAEYIQEHPSAPQRSLAYAHKGLGWSQYRKRHYDLAVEKFLVAGRSKEYEVDAAKGAGLAYYEMEKYKDAAEFLKIAHNANPNDLDVAYKLDWSILRGWDSALASTYFEQSLKKYPLRASLYMGQGWILYKTNHPDMAVEYFLKAISLDPDFALTTTFSNHLAKERYGWQVYNSLGWAYYQNRNYIKSLEMFQTSIKSQPNKSEARKGMGYNLYALGKYELAATFLEQSLRINSDPTPVLETDYDSEEGYEHETTARTKLGRIYYQLDRPQEAIVQFNQELKLRPNQADALDGLGWSYLKLNRLAEARTAFAQSLQIQPLNSLSHKGLSEVKVKIATEKLDSNPREINAPVEIHPHDVTS